MRNTAPRIDGARIAVVVEHKFIDEEITAYMTGFPLLGATVELISRIHYPGHVPPSVTFYSDVDPLDNEPWETPHKVQVSQDISKVRLQEYAAIIMSANYTSVRLRYSGELPADVGAFDPVQHVRSAPTTQFFAEAMENKNVVKGALCHGLWILTPVPALLKGRRVICHSVVMADVLNCGAEIVLTPERVVRDEDLVTGFSKKEVPAFMAAIAQAIADSSG